MITRRRIGAINGLTITTSTPWALTVAGGTVYTTGAILQTNTDTRVIDLHINGDSVNQPWFNWATTWGIILAGDHSRLEHCDLYDMASEGVEITGYYPVVEGCIVQNANGNGFHLAESTWHPVVHACAVVNCNLGVSTGHTSGGIAISSDVTNATVSDCYVYGCYSGVGSFHYTGNSDATIANNTIRSCTYSGISIVQTATNSAAGRLVISGNRIYACPVGIMVTTSLYTNSPWPNRITIASNSFDLCKTYSIQLQYADYINVTGNRFEGATGASLPIHVYITDCKEIPVTGNEFNGGACGVYVQSPNGQVQDVVVSSNTFTAQYNTAIQFATAGMTNCTAIGNVISNDLTASATYTAINVEWPNTVSGNVITLNNNSGALGSLTGILLNTSIASGIFGTASAIGNVVRGTGLYGIRSVGGSGGGAILNNLTTATAPLSIGGGTVTTPAVLGTTTLSGGVIQTVPVTSGGTGYSAAPYLWVIGGGGSGASLTAVMSSGAISSVTVTAGGTGYTGAPTIIAAGNYQANNQTVV